jgi:hypothetical protein
MSSGYGHAAISGISRIELPSGELALLARTRLVAIERDCAPERAIILEYSRKDGGTGAAHAHDLNLRRRNLTSQIQALRPGLRSRDGLRQSGDLLCQNRIARGGPAQAVAPGILRRARFAFGCPRAVAPAAVPAAGLPPRFSYRAAGTFVWLAHLLPLCSLFVLQTNPRFWQAKFSHVYVAHDLSAYVADDLFGLWPRLETAVNGRAHAIVTFKGRHFARHRGNLGLILGGASAGARKRHPPESVRCKMAGYARQSIAANPSAMRGVVSRETLRNGRLRRH